MSAGPAEVLGLSQSIAYAQHLAEQAGTHSPDGNEGYLLRLQAARVTGNGLTTGSAMQEAFAAAAAAATAHAAQLDRQISVQEAYDQNPDAGDKDYLTGDTASSGAGTDLHPDQAKETPVNEDNEIDPFTGMTQTTLAAYRAYNEATYPFLNRHNERQDIEAQLDAQAELVDQGRRTAKWYLAGRAVLLARTEEIDRMVAALRPGDHVRLADDPDGVVWSVREIRDGNDGWVWLGLRRTREDGTQVGTGCRARGVDLVAKATDDEHADMVKAELASDLRNKWITQEEYDVALAELASTGTTGAHR